MHKKLIPLALSGMVISGSLATLASQEEPYKFEANDGTSVDAFRGSFMVPENRTRSGSRDIKISYVRFPSTSEMSGAPIVYLAGGPGGSGIDTARRQRFTLFMAMREFGDVIAYDQRGTGWSNDIPKFQSDYVFSLDQPMSLDDPKGIVDSILKECATFWKDAGVDISGYNTLESARDIEDLRKALGVEKISLWGISYGTHLAMAAIREMPGKIDRVVMAAVEGLDQTVKLPIRTDAYFDRLQVVINTEPEAAQAFPDLKGLMRRVHEKYAANPVEISFQNRSGEMITFMIGKVELQLLASSMIADPVNAAKLPGMYWMADTGNFEHLGPLIFHYFRKNGISFRGMPEAMDIMSGISDTRLAKVSEQSKTSLLGDLLNYPMPHIVGMFGLEDLGATFRAPVSTNLPTLVFSGTLDGRTYPESAKEALAGFTNLSHVIVRNGGHNVFMQAPIISEIVLDFMRGKDVPQEVTLKVPSFVR